MDINANIAKSSECISRKRGSNDEPRCSKKSKHIEDHFSRLPSEMILAVYKQMNLQSAREFRRTCKRMDAIYGSNPRSIEKLKIAVECFSLTIFGSLVAIHVQIDYNNAITYNIYADYEGDDVATLEGFNFRTSITEESVYQDTNFVSENLEKDLKAVIHELFRIYDVQMISVTGDRLEDVELNLLLVAVSDLNVKSYNFYDVTFDIGDSGNWEKFLHAVKPHRLIVDNCVAWGKPILTKEIMGSSMKDATEVVLLNSYFSESELDMCCLLEHNLQRLDTGLKTLKVENIVKKLQNWINGTHSIVELTTEYVSFYQNDIFDILGKKTRSADHVMVNCNGEKLAFRWRKVDFMTCEMQAVRC